MATPAEVSTFIIEYIIESGVPYAHWYVGIASKPKERLFQHHHVSERDGRWAYKNAGSEEVARQAESLIIDHIGTQGGSGAGDKSTTYVYAYVITNDTLE
jgi:hypothetical protein